MEQNIIGLGFDLAAFDAQTQRIIDGLEEVYNLGRKIGETAIKPGSAGGFTELKAAIDATSKLTTEQTKLTAAIKAKEAAEAKAIKTAQEKLKTEKQTLSYTEAQAKAELDRINATKESIRYQQALQKEKAKGLSDAAAEAKIAAQLMDEYGVLNKALKEQELRYKNLALTHGFESEAAKEALQTALETRNVLDKLDGNLRNYQHSVGNYKSAFDGLGMSFTQVARELPSLTISAQQFFLAISNNLPMVFDEIKKAKQDIADLKEQGKEAPSLGARIAKSLLSWQVALSVIITLVTAFGGKLIDAASNALGLGVAFKESAKYLDLMAKTAKELNDVLKDRDFAYNLYLEGGVDQMKNQLSVMQALGKSNGDILQAKKKIAEQELHNNDITMKGGADALEFYKGNLQAVYNTIGNLTRELEEFQRKGPVSGDDDDIEKYEKGMARIIDRLNERKDKYKEINGVISDYYNKTSALEAVKAEVEKYNAEQKLLRETELRKREAQAKINDAERTLADERKFEVEKLQALETASAARIRIMNAEADKIRKTRGNKNADGSYTAEADTALKNIEAQKVKEKNDTEDAKFKITEEFRKRRLAAELAGYKAETEFAAAQYKQVSETESADFADRMIAYGDYYRAEQDLIQKDHDFQIATKTLTGEELVALEKETARKLKELQVRSKKEISEIIVSNASEQLSLAASMDNLKLSEEELKIYRSLKKKEDFQRQAQKLELKLQKETLQNAITQDSELLSNSRVTEDEKKKAQQRIYDNQAKLNKLALTDEQQNESNKKSQKELRYQLETVAVGAFFDLASKLSDNYHAKRLQQLSDERKAIDENYTKQIENIRNSTVSEQEKAAAIIQLNAVQASKKAEIDKKEKEEKYKQAKFDKALTIGRIITETALAVIHQLATGDPYSATMRAVLAGATGAAQLAVAIASPLPTYGEGTDNAADGPIIVGEKRKGAGFEPEFVEPKSGPSFWTNRPMLLNGMKGAKITPISKMKDSIDSAMYSSMMMATAQMLGGSVDGVNELKEIKDAVLMTGHMTAKALRKQKGANVTVHVHTDWGNYIAKNVRE